MNQKKKRKNGFSQTKTLKFGMDIIKKIGTFFLVKGFSQTKALNFVEVYVLWKIVSGIQINVFWK